jgi:hypothetical protein
LIRLRQQHWMLALLLALITHLAAYLYSINFLGGEPSYRGGGSFDQNDQDSSSSAGVFVQLRNSGKSPSAKLNRPD